jgi:hypothetical protein
MATATPSPTPNPNALRFALDVSLADTITASSPDEADAIGSPFLAAVLAIDGVVSVFGTSDFVTVTRRAGADWDTIVPAVQAAAAEHL